MRPSSQTSRASTRASCSARRRDDDSAVVGISTLLTTLIGTPLWKLISPYFLPILRFNSHTIQHGSYPLRLHVVSMLTADHFARRRLKWQERRCARRINVLAPSISWRCVDSQPRERERVNYHRKHSASQKACQGQKRLRPPRALRKPAQYLSRVRRKVHLRSEALQHIAPDKD